MNKHPLLRARQRPEGAAEGGARGIFSKYLENRPLFSKYYEKRPIHMFLIDTFQFIQITIIYKGTQVTSTLAIDFRLKLAFPWEPSHKCASTSRLGRRDSSFATGLSKGFLQSRETLPRTVSQLRWPIVRLLISQDVGKMGFRQISLNIYILYQK